MTSPDLRGRRVWIAPADHSHANEQGVVIDQVPCGVCKAHPGHDCGYEDLIVRLDSGEQTRIYEPEVEMLPTDRVLPPPDVIACGAKPDVPLCPDCIDAYRNGIEPGETACEARYHHALGNPL